MRAPSRLARQFHQAKIREMNQTARQLVALKARLAPLRQSLLAHPVYGRIDDLASLRCFMEHHVFAVWDFMSLLKALQRSLTCVELPWTPPANRTACRLINEIVLAEESDSDGHGSHRSHFELYLDAMAQYGAKRTPIHRLIDSLKGGHSLDQAVGAAGIPMTIRQFIQNTFAIINTAQPAAIAASFTFGREDLLPDVFKRIIEESAVSTHESRDAFRYYLDRHIELDGGDHGPSAELLVQEICQDDPAQWMAAENAAVQSLESRLVLWDGVCQELDRHSASAVHHPANIG
jgi:hypothetical protein